MEVAPSTVFALLSGDSGFNYPVAQYDHDAGQAIAGGFVYRGGSMHNLDGQFIFGDTANGRIFYADAAGLLAADDGNASTTAPIQEVNLLRNGVPTTLLKIVADTLELGSINRVDLRFATDLNGNLYVTTKQDGFIRQLVPVPEATTSAGLLAGTLFIGLISGRVRHAAGGLRLTHLAARPLGSASSKRG